MLNSKDRAKLRSLAMDMQPTTHIGKGGISDTVIAEIDQYLEARELMKVVVLKNADFTAKDIAEDVAEAVNAEVVQVLGQKITLYRLSQKDKIKHILG